MKKLSIAMVLTTVTCVAAGAVLQDGNFVIASATDCNHIGNHYTEKTNTETEYGIKEYWACCICHQQFLEKPLNGEWTDNGVADVELDEDDDRYIPEDYIDTTFNFRTLNRRLDYILGSSATTGETAKPVFSNSNFNAYIHDYAIARGYSSDPYNGYGPFYWNANPDSNINDHLLYLLDNTYLPLNVQARYMGLYKDEEMSSSIIFKNKSYERHTNKRYENKTSETVLSCNTGYLVGGGAHSDASKVCAKYRHYGVMYKSLNLENIDSAIIPNENYIESNLQALTTVDGETWNRIEDVHNTGAETNSELAEYETANSESLDLLRYNEVKSEYVDILKSSNVLHGVNFKDPHTTAFTYQTINDAVINDGKGSPKKDSYQLVKMGLNFSLSEPSVVSMFFVPHGTDANASETIRHSAFKLFSVNRNDSGVITSTPTEISSVYMNKETNEVSIGDNAPNGSYSKVYGTDWFTDLPKANALYYIEVPLPAGDYFLNNIPIGTGRTLYGAYMVHLNINPINK